MKNPMTKAMIAAAVLAAATGVASAQPLKAEVPFAFRAGGKVMPPGAYSVEIAGPRHEIVILRNYAAQETALLIASNPDEPSKAWVSRGIPVLSFACTMVRCSLVHIWNGTPDPALTFPRTVRRGEERASITEIPLVRATE
jgi:hypothetical protein